MIRATFLFTVLALCFTAQAKDRVLLVVSGAGTTEDPESGYEFDELTQAYWTFADNEFEVDIASPAGGQPVSEEINERWAFNQRFLANEAAMASIKNTLRIDSVEAARYDALFVIGGSGAAIDLPHESALISLIARMADSGSVIGAVCHGPAALLNVQVDGAPFVRGRQLTAFTGEEEALFGKIEDPAKSLEHQLISRGAAFSEAPVMGLHSVTDGRLVTGQNPFSTAVTAEAVIRALGRTPAVRQPYRSETTMRLAQLAREKGREAAAKQLGSDPDAVEPMFIALLGYYQLKAATKSEAIAEAITLIELSLPYFQHDAVRMALADGYERLGQLDSARRVLRELLEEKPGFEPAREMLLELTG